MGEAKKIKFRIQRYNPENGVAPYMDEFVIPVTRGMTVLDGLFYIKENLDNSLAFRSSCRMAICGSCAVVINSFPHLACHTQIAELRVSTLELKPVPNYAIIKDLVVDLSPLFQKHRAIKPYLIRSEREEMDAPSAEFLQTPQELEAYLQFSYCVKCGLCLAACPTAASDRLFLGPQAIAQCYRYSSDSRDDGAEERFPAVDGDHGLWRCHLAGACSEACPKGVDPAFAIQLLKRLRVSRALGLGRGRRPTPVAPPPTAMQPKLPVPEFTVKPETALRREPEG
ncbi:MAG TPA: succinate dehydrogenase iron-sulfur subunit [Dehalococcoidia bacterium]|nr:succinate dehydrogenase iron-sulfur subunit [Dehalococcoidia bacterium]